MGQRKFFGRRKDNPLQYSCPKIIPQTEESSGLLSMSFKESDMMQQPNNKVNNPKIYMELQKTQNYQSNPDEKEQSWKQNPSRLRQHYKTTVIKKAWYQHGNRHTLQWKRMECLKINPHNSGPLIYEKGGKNIQFKKCSLFNKWFWESWTSIYFSMKLEHSHHTIYKNKLRMVFRLKYDVIP